MTKLTNEQKFYLHTPDLKKEYTTHIMCVFAYSYMLKQHKPSKHIGLLKLYSSWHTVSVLSDIWILE